MVSDTVSRFLKLRENSQKIVDKVAKSNKEVVVFILVNICKLLNIFLLIY